MMAFLLLLLAGTILFQMGSATNTLYKYNISGTIYSTSENGADKVMPDIHIYLIEKDNWPNWDDDMGDAVTDGQGHFEVVGEEDEGNEPEPFLRIDFEKCGGLLRYVRISVI
jgi:hypothetical protein